MLEIVFLLMLAVLFSFGTALEYQQQRISDAMVRLHVLANSDSDYDQKIKEQVRDAVLEEAEKLLYSADRAETAKRILRNNLDRLEAAANKILSDNEYAWNAKVSLRRQLFGTRHYEGFSLPGGYYDTLCVTIGSGEGKNWWCVVYPQICSAAMADQQSVAVMGGINREDMEMLRQGTKEYELRFRTLELFENFMGWLRSFGDGIPTSR